MKRPGSQFAKKRTLAIVSLLLVVLFLGLPVPGFFAIIEAGGRLFMGFAFFLSGNLHKTSSDAGTWGPGLAAFLLGLVVIHWFGRSWARHRQRPWKVSSTLALGMIVPLLFAISFLVPGVVLQVASLQQATWFGYGHSKKAGPMAQARNIAQAAHAWANIEGADRFPDSTQNIISAGLLGDHEFTPQGLREDVPGEPPLYLGAGLSLESDPSLPLVISGIYSRNETYYRTVITVGSEFVEIRAEELDGWIARATTGRDGAKP